jgi:hypothetical protein
MYGGFKRIRSRTQAWQTYLYHHLPLFRPWILRIMPEEPVELRGKGLQPVEKVDDSPLVDDKRRPASTTSYRQRDSDSESDEEKEGEEHNIYGDLPPTLPPAIAALLAQGSGGKYKKSNQPSATPTKKLTNHQYSSHPSTPNSAARSSSAVNPTAAGPAVATGIAHNNSSSAMQSAREAAAAAHRKFSSLFPPPLLSMTSKALTSPAVLSTTIPVNKKPLPRAASPLESPQEGGASRAGTADANLTTQQRLELSSSPPDVLVGTNSITQQEAKMMMINEGQSSGDNSSLGNGGPSRRVSDGGHRLSTSASVHSDGGNDYTGEIRSFHAPSLHHVGSGWSEDCSGGSAMSGYGSTSGVGFKDRTNSWNLQTIEEVHHFRHELRQGAHDESSKNSDGGIAMLSHCGNDGTHFKNEKMHSSSSLYESSNPNV